MNRKSKSLSVPLLMYVMAYCVVGWAVATGIIYLVSWLSEHLRWVG